MGLSLGCGGADVGEDADVSDDAGLCGGREDSLGRGGARWWVRYRFRRICGELLEDLPNSLPFLRWLRCLLVDV